MKRPLRLVLLIGSTQLLACSSGETPPVVTDLRVRDRSRADLPAPDLWQPDKGPKPDKWVKPDLGPKPDLGLCGNKQVDPGEACDKGIAVGKPGACPLTAADCDDQNKCTTDSLIGSVTACSADCEWKPLPNCCGNGKLETGEECDDGNIVDKDGCSNACKLPGGHLLLTEVAVAPSEAEFAELYNPGPTAVKLDNTYLADRIDYFLISAGSINGASTDFVARFPAGATIAAGAYVTVATDGALFKMAYGKAPDYELTPSDPAVPDMLPAVPGSIGSQAGMTDTGEVLMLFTWDGKSDLVQDLDYVVWKGSSASAIAKSATICVDGLDTDTTTTCYKDDTLVTSQSFLAPPQQGGSIHRCDYHEGTEKKTAGNGATGHDETSEPFDGVGATWKRNPNTITLRTPGGPAPVGFCTP